MKINGEQIKKLIEDIRRIGDGKYNAKVATDGDDDIGRLARAIDRMREKLGERLEELNKQRDEYQIIFEQAPCYITVQDRNLKLIKYNREFAEKFSPESESYCYQAYKGRSDKCEACPVLKTFEDGKSHSSEETGVGKDGSRTYWLVRSAPITDRQGEVIAAMEISLDLTQMKQLEKEVRASEIKYHIIFNNIPDPVFVLDKKNMKIIDCNDSVRKVYGFTKHDILQTSFLDLFAEEEREYYVSRIRTSNALNQVRQIHSDGKTIYVNIRIAAVSDYLGRETLLVTTSDITAKLMAEQQLIQASKMATLGEMATGVAHELNQPLSVIKTASSFLKKKAANKMTIQHDILQTMTEEIDSHVDRASGIINHLREFGRKSDVKMEFVQMNDAFDRAYNIFRQQLKLRQIEVVMNMEEDLPPIMADSNRLEQVFVNLLINARDAIEENRKAENKEKKIFVKTSSKGDMVTIEIKDTGGGIPKSIVDKIFEPFFTTKKVGKGTGLGLSISYGIVQDYNGSIRVETQEGVSSTFIIQFPIMDKA